MQNALVTPHTSDSPSPPLRGKRLLFIVNEGAFLLSHRLSLAQAAQREGMDIYVACPHDASVSRLEALGFRHVHLSLSRWSSNPLKEIRTAFAILSVLRSVRPDLLHNVTIKPVIYGSLISRLSSTRAVVNSVSGLGYVFLSSGIIARLRLRIVMTLYCASLHRTGTFVIFQNQADRELFLKSRVIRKEQSVLIQGSGVNEEEFPPLNLPLAGPFTVLLVARLLREKGLAEFLDAADIILREHPEMKFIVAGDYPMGNPGAISREDFLRLKQHPAVRWVGFVDNIHSLLASCHAFCLPSYREGLSRALIEAAASGRPIVTTEVPGCRELVQDGVNGYLVPPMDPQGLAHALLRLAQLHAENPQQLATFGQASRALFLRGEFKESTVNEQTLALYSHALSLRRPVT